jgi:hypothetical protein
MLGRCLDTKEGERQHIYYRCAQYHRGDHPRIRMTEAEFDEQIMVLFDKLRIETPVFTTEKLPESYAMRTRTR